MEGKRVADTPKGGHRAAVIFFGVLGVLLAAYIGLCAWVVNNGLALPGVQLAGQDVSGMNHDQLVNVLNTKMAQNDTEVELHHGDFSARLEGSYFKIDTDATANLAIYRGKESFFAAGWQYLSGLLGTQRQAFAGGVMLTDEGWRELERLLDQVNRKQDPDFDPNHYQLDMEQGTLTMTRGVTQRLVDWDSTYMELCGTAFPSALNGLEYMVELQVEEIPYVNPEFEGIWREIHSQAVEPVYDKQTGTVSDHAVGIDFAVEELKAAYEGAAEGETFSIPLTVTQPKDTRQSYEQKLFADVLGSGKSQVTGTANRKTNVKLSAAACDGVILMPGEIFSYNNTTGSRTADKGYLPAPTYNAGASVDDVGGGICQTSSTIYYALLHTPLKIVERQNHSYATGYVPDGMDATVFFGSLDFRFENSTNYPLKIVTESYDQNGKRYLKVDLLGTNEDGRYAKPTNYVFDVVQPTNTYVADETVPQGTLVLDKKQNSYRGRKAQVTRTIYAADGTVVEEQDLGTSRYKMRPNVYFYNPLDGDPATWPNGQPPKPQPAAPVAPAVPETPAAPVAPESPAIPNPTVPIEPVVPNGTLPPTSQNPVVEITNPPMPA